MNKILPLLFIVIITILFFWQFFLKGLLPVPADTIIGLYHPYRDLYAKDYPNGIPFKNFLITDPVRQQYPWRELVISIEKRLELPLWNPYQMSGTPLLANFQSAAFYPLNILLFLLPLNIAWSILIFLQPLLAGIFLYLYLRNLKVNIFAAVLGSLAFAFSGFSVAWMEWGTMVHSAMWLPLILLSIDKIFSNLSSDNLKLQFKNKKLLVWSFIFVFSLISSFFAGHLQIFFYIFLFSIIYFFIKWIQNGKKKNIFILYLVIYTFFLILTAIQWYPTLQFIMESARDLDLVWQKEGWFIPWEHLVQFLVPDFFGNPTTLNYWGTWNYGELIGYIGILPLIFALFALFFRHDKKTLLFGSIFFLSLIFSLPTFFAKLPFILNIPFLSTAQPTRLLFLVDFSLAILAALGLDYFVSKLTKKIFYSLGFAAVILIGLWSLVLLKDKGIISSENLIVVKNNLVLPTIIFIVIALFITFFIFFQLHSRLRGNPKEYRLPIRLTSLKLWRTGSGMTILLILLIGITIFDLLRFGLKFTPFTNKEYLFPTTKTIAFLKNQPSVFRIMAVDDRILPPNFSAVYRLQTIDGYDPLYLQRYAELIASSERNNPNINPPFGFNRIITPKNYESKIIDLLGVKYVLSLNDISSPKLKKVFQEGKTHIYENTKSMPRVYFITDLYNRNSQKEVIEFIFENSEFKEKAVIETEENDKIDLLSKWSDGKAEIVNYSENKVTIKTKNSGDGFLVLTDSFYPTWKAKVDGRETKIYRTNYNFRGIIVPKGEHNIEFYITLF